MAQPDAAFLTRMAAMLASSSETGEAVVEAAVLALAIIAAERRLHYVAQICTLAAYENPSETAKEVFGAISDTDLINALIFGQRVNEAIHVKLYGASANERTVPANTRLPARLFNLPKTDRWVGVDDIRQLISEVRAKALLLPAKRRIAWIEHKLIGKAASLNARLRDGALMQIQRHAMALNEMYWRRITGYAPKDSVHLRLHCSSAFLEATIRVGGIAFKRRVFVQKIIFDQLSSEERSAADSHMGLRGLASIVFHLNLAIHERRPMDQLNSALKGLYDLLLRELFDHPEVAAALAALPAYPTLTIATHAVLAIIPYAALHDGDGFLAERFNVVFAPIIPGGADFIDGLVDFDSIVGGEPLAGRGVKVLADTLTLPQARYELDHYRQLDDAGAIRLSEIASDRSRPWNRDSVRQLLDATDIALLSAHVAAPRTAIEEAAIVSPLGETIRFVDVIASDQQVGLLVLSGCVSVGTTDWLGAGENSVVALFRLHGVGSIIATLWPVNDFAARHYNQALLTALGQGMSRAQAHGDAQRSVMSMIATRDQLRSGERIVRQRAASAAERIKREEGVSLSHPYYWSGFSLYGMWS
ncbi:CHAT domain-containing protein [Sphingomonas naphthae]|uniref:CHAT domain-containing protein n=1 Tax=Sphingomonas naphthae TaxID=1813468 RepID=A0ABY7TMP4_9SPHN|nr:CHAT domain-containing protein [Sphingomonas naphthae]WCT74288.1 CHAT domain-containing protein [Sphingomonas naphthae]